MYMHIYIHTLLLPLIIGVLLTGVRRRLCSLSMRYEMGLWDMEKNKEKKTLTFSCTGEKSHFGFPLQICTT